MLLETNVGAGHECFVEGQRSLGKGNGKDKGNQKGKGQQKSGSGTGKLGAAPAASGSGAAKDVVCHNCGRKGHKKSECWHPGGGGGGANANKGKRKAVGAAEGTEPASEGSTDIGAVSDGGPSRLGGWTRLNFDSGCGKTVLPVRYTNGKPDRDSSTYDTASGEILSDHGSATISCVGDNGLHLRVVGRAAE
eukprot:744916-Amphidinium_carterae.1